MGKVLGGGLGWVLLIWSLCVGCLINVWVVDYMMIVVDGEVFFVV